MKKDVVTGFIYVIAVIQLTSCEEQNVNPIQDRASVTENFQKIETSYEAGNEKIEGLYVGEKRETESPNEYIYEMMERVNREVNSINKKSRFQSARTIYDGYDVGVIPSGWNLCPSWSETIKIFMDCEDSDPATSMTAGWSGTWSTDGFNKNLWMVYCRVDGRLFGPDMLPGAGIYSYNLLKLGYQTLPGAYTLTRYFDNEDHNNKNKHEGDISPNISDTNTTLYFQYFAGGGPDSGGISWPDLGFSYGVIGKDCCNGPFGAGGGSIVNVDDEDNNNANWMTVNGIPTSNAQSIVGGSNTTIYIARRK